MTVGRTNFFPKDAGWHRRARIVELGIEHGPAGPLVMDWLTCEAKAQNPVPESTGEMRTGYASIAQGCYIDAEAARNVVGTAVDIGLLDDFEDFGRIFTCRISGWREDVVLKLEAQRKADSRAARKQGADVRKRPEPSGDVRKCPEVSGVVRFSGKVVPAARLAAAERALVAFNAKAGTNYRALGSDGKPTENLKRIIGAMTRDDRITAEIAERMIDQALSVPNPFWGGSPPHLGHVFTPNVVEANLERALGNGTAAGPLNTVDAVMAAQDERQRRQQNGAA